jgi:NAD+ synthase (glutamine-hydrolysing)
MAAALESAGFELDAQEMNAWFVGVASVGGYGTEVYAGGSFVIDPQGALVAAAPSFEDALLVADVDVSPAAEHIAGHETGRADGRAAEYALSHVAHDMPHLDPYEPALYAWQAVARAIADFAEAQAKTDVALALDGSLSSQAIAVLASDALGPAHVHVLVSSCAGRLAASCRELARRLRIDQRDGTAPAQGFDARDWAGLELARLARESQALVLGTWDKTALALGLVPDSVSAAAFAPLGDVYRTDVLEMAHLRNSISPIFRRVALHAADGFVLRDPEGKEHRINGERELLQVDTILLDYLEYSRTLADICTNTDFDTQLVAAVLDACRAGEALRRRLAPALVMGSCPLAEAGFPLGVAWDDRTFELPSDNEMLPISFAMPDLESALRADDMAASADDADDDDAFAEAHRGGSHDPDWYDDADAKSVNGMGPRHDDGVRQDSDGTDAQDSGPDGEGTRREGWARRARNEALPREARDFEATLSMLRDIFEQGGLGPATTPLRTDDPEHPQGPSWTTLFSEN